MNKSRVIEIYTDGGDGICVLFFSTLGILF